MSVNVLPDMDEPRLRSLGKQLNRSRKSSIISHDRLKDELNVYKKSLNKEQRSLDGKYQKTGLRLKHKLARVRGTQKCLRRKREQTFFEDTEDFPYGLYEGESLHSYRREIDDIIDKKHPKYRRQKKVDQYLQTSKVNGSILEDEDIKMHFDFIMNRKHETRDTLSSYMQRENPLSLTFLGDKRGITKNFSWKSPNAPVLNKQSKVRNWLKPIGPSPLLDHGDNDTFSRTTTLERGTPRSVTPAESGSDRLTDLATVRSPPPKLNLPPLTARKDFVSHNRGKAQKTSLSLPSLSVRRATKCDTLSRDDAKRLKEVKNRRMSTFI